MTTAVRRAPRWSKKTDQLVRHVAYRCRPRLQSELGQWLDNSSRFSAFMTAYQDKVRKKLTTAEDEESRLDVRSELLVAYRLLADRRFELAFEALGARRLGPDLTATYRGNFRFHLEVTRLRATAAALPTGDPASAQPRDAQSSSPGAGSAGPRSPASSGAEPASVEPSRAETAVAARLANVVAGKLRQLPGDLPNALLITTADVPLTENTLAGAARVLKAHAGQKDDAFFGRRGYRAARDFHVQYLHLSATVSLDESTAEPAAKVNVLLNREARHPLPRDVVAALLACLSSDRHAQT